MRSSARFLPIALIVLAPSGALAAVYNLLHLHAGANFFDGFHYRGTYNFTQNTPTVDIQDHSFNYWANETVAMATGLTRVLQNGDAIISVDNVTDGSGFAADNMALRMSVRIDSDDYYGTGNVFVTDIVHLPWGCSVWPALWLSGNDGTFPAGGEIDIVEEVNMAVNNQVNIHADGACRVPVTTPNAGRHQNCGDADTGNLGCSFQDPSLVDYGDAFNAAGGGMWITEFSADAINVWFYERANVPPALTTAANASSIDTSTLGTPLANIPASKDNCNFGQLFNPVKLVISVALCGLFAGAEGVFPATCDLTPGLNASQTCYQTWVAGPGSNYDDAYFQIASVRVFNDGSPSSYGTDNQTVLVAQPGAGGPVAGESASASGGITSGVASSVVSVSTSSAAGGGGSSAGAPTHTPGAAPRGVAVGIAGPLGAFLLFVVAGAVLAML